MSIDRLLAGLEDARRSAPDPARVLDLLALIDRENIDDAALLVRFHDALLFLCAYPPAPRILRRAESILKRFGRRFGGNSPLLDSEASGIAGTSVDVVFSYDIVCWLARHFPRQIDIDWDEEPDSDRLAAVLAQLLPILGEEIVEAHAPYFERLRTAGGLPWLLKNLERLQRRAVLYDSLQLRIQWTLGNSAATRTAMRRPPRTIFFQRTRPLARRDVSIARELAGPSLPISRLSPREGRSVLDMARAALATRYRELYGFTWGDPATVLCAEAGRGLEIVLVGIVPGRRLPLRAGFAPFLMRNGVPIGYADAFGLCERMEVSFNIFYAFRDGESAFCFARLLKLYHQLFGSTTFSIDPYQIGAGNDEAIEAGAFWFYRKLGFRPADPAVDRIARREEEQMANDPRHRTTARTLRKLARSPMLYEAEGARKGEWDRFQIGNLVRRLRPLPGLIPDLERWSADERAGLQEILRAKAGRSETKYLRLLAAHPRLRRVLLRLGGA